MDDNFRLIDIDPSTLTTKTIVELGGEKTESSDFVLNNGIDYTTLVLEEQPKSIEPLFEVVSVDENNEVKESLPYVQYNEPPPEIVKSQQQVGRVFTLSPEDVFEEVDSIRTNLINDTNNQYTISIKGILYTN